MPPCRHHDNAVLSNRSGESVCVCGVRLKLHFEACDPQNANLYMKFILASLGRRCGLALLPGTWHGTMQPWSLSRRSAISQQLELDASGSSRQPR